MNFWNLLGALAAMVFVAGCGNKGALEAASSKPSSQAKNGLNTPMPPRIHLLLVNGKTGKPMTKQNLNVSWDDSFSETTVYIPASGFADVSIPVGAKTVQVMPGPRVGKESYRVAYQNCNSAPVLESSIQEVMAEGLAVGNDCSREVRITPKPGEVIFYGRPLPWWQPDFQ